MVFHTAFQIYFLKPVNVKEGFEEEKALKNMLFI